MKPWSSIWRRKKKEEESLSSEGEMRLLDFFDLSAVGVGGSLAFGVWVLVGHLVKNVAGPAAVVSISLAGVAALAGGLCLAEFGVRFLKADSSYVYCYLGSNQNGAFVFGWAVLLQYLAGVASGAKGAIAFIDSLTEHQISDFLNSVAPLNSPEVFPHFDFISLLVVSVIVLLISIGIKDSIPVKKFFTAINVVLIVVVIAAGAFRAELKNWFPKESTPEEEAEVKFNPYGLLGVAKGATVAFYGFIGFETVSITGNEVKRRKRNIPLAITATVLFSLASYAGVGVVLSLMRPYQKLDPHAPVPLAFQEAGWTALKWIVVAATFCGFQTSLFGAAFALPKIIYAMANDGLLFHWLGNTHLRLRTPMAASMTGGLMAALAAGFIPFEELVNVAVIAALFVLTILATNVILLRYTPEPPHATECNSQSCFATEKNCDVSVKTVIRSLFDFTEKFSTNLTKKIIIGNLISFVLSSICITVIFKFFHESLIECTSAAVAPTGVLLCILLLNVISIMCQPKSDESAPFKVPLVPLLPCASIFVNIFLLQSFESLTWILFLSWLALGVIPYSAWRCVKRFRKEYDENSLYEINKSNAIKLSESIWKMKSNKKSFYEGAINPVFLDDDEECVNDDALEQIEKSDPTENEKAKFYENLLQLKFAYAEHEEIENDSSEIENVRWECVAEIHEEVELPGESVALEIVDNTYNFLTEISKEDALQPSAEGSTISRSEEEPETSSSEGTENVQPTAQKPERVQFKQELLDRIKERMKNTNDAESKEETQSDKNNEETPSWDDDQRGKTTPNNDYNGNYSSDSNNNNDNSESSDNNNIYSNNNNGSDNNHNRKSSSNSSRDNNKNNNPPEPEEPVPDEHNKIKLFKEKLNQLLKSQINGGTILSKNSQFSKTNVVDGIESESNDETDKNILRDSVKTLSKSQIKGRLELLLSKGPSRRPPLGSSFNAKVKETDDETESEKPKVEIVDERKTQKSDGQKFDNTDKVLALDNSELSGDVNC